MKTLSVASLMLMLVVTGCSTLTGAEAKNLQMNMQTVITTLQDSGAEGDAELYITPNGSVNVGPGFSYSNGSYLKARVRIDPTKGRLINEAVTDEK